MSLDLPPENPPPSSGAAPPVSAGWLEIALPLWRRKGWLLGAAIACAAAAGALAFTRPVRYTAIASFVVQPALRPSQASAGALPALAGLAGVGGAPVDLHAAILRSQSVTNRIIDRFELQRAWGYAQRARAEQRLVRNVSFVLGRREGVVQVQVDDELAQRAAAIANEYVEELRATLRRFALDEARQRRQFFEAQLAAARASLEAAQRSLQISGYDRAALRAEPRAAADSYARAQAEVSAAELRLAATRRVRAEGSPEVEVARAELAARRGQLAALEAPQDEAPGSFIARWREYRYAEALVDSISRQAENARADEAGDPLGLQVLDRARVPAWPSSPQPLLWLAGGAAGGIVVQAAWVLLRHRQAMARLDPAYRDRLALIRAVLDGRR